MGVNIFSEWLFSITISSVLLLVVVWCVDTDALLFVFFFPITVPIVVIALSLHRINHFFCGVNSFIFLSVKSTSNRDYLKVLVIVFCYSMETSTAACSKRRSISSFEGISLKLLLLRADVGDAICDDDTDTVDTTIACQLALHCNYKIHLTSMRQFCVITDFLFTFEF